MGRFAGPDPLPPIPFTVSAPVWIGLAGFMAVVVLVAVAVSMVAPHDGRRWGGFPAADDG